MPKDFTGEMTLSEAARVMRNKTPKTPKYLLAQAAAVMSASRKNPSGPRKKPIDIPSPQPA